MTLAVELWNMPWYRQDIDLNQKQVVTVSTETTLLKRSFGARFIMAKCFYSENVIEIMTLVHEL